MAGDTANFICQEHTVPAQHIREHARATALRQEDVLHLAVKQYTPRSSLPHQPGDITILACHSSGFPKELYEPVWDELLRCSEKTKAFRIRSIWIADVSNQGYSGVLNEDKLGNQPSYHDSARDLLLLVNYFRDEMPRPIVGVGHSMGGNVIVNLALLHPRLLTSVIAVEAIINHDAQAMRFETLFGLAFKRGSWASREEAEIRMRSNAFFKTWDPRVLDRYFAHAFRDDADSDNGRIILRTTKHQESFSFARCAYPPRDSDDHNPSQTFYLPEATMTYDRLPFLRPSCYWIYGSNSQMHSASREGRRAKLETTGTARGGSGGSKLGVVQEATLHGSHFVPFERPREFASLISEWLGPVMQRWHEEERQQREDWERIPREKRAQIDDDWRYWVKAKFGRQHKASGSASTVTGTGSREAKL